MQAKLRFAVIKAHPHRPYPVRPGGGTVHIGAGKPKSGIDPSESILRRRIHAARRHTPRHSVSKKSACGVLFRV